MRQRGRSSLPDLCAHPQRRIGLGIEALRRLGAEVGVGAQAAAWMLGSIHTDVMFNRKRFAGGLRGAPRSSPAAPGAAGSLDRRDASADACAAAALPCLTASAPAPMSLPAVGTRRCGVLTA